MSAEADAANTMILVIAIMTLIVAAILFIADYIKTRRFYSRFNRHSERHLYKYGTRIIGRDYK